MVSTRSSAGRIRARFADREDLGRAGAVTAYWSHLPRVPLDELFDLIEAEFSLPAGLLRPEDPVARLTAPLAIENPLTWLWAEAALEDAASELDYRFRKRVKAAGMAVPAVFPETIERLVDLWCNPAA